MEKAEQIFVVGYSRSGTTMMGRVMGRNAEVFTFHEIHFFEQLYFPGSDVSQFTNTDAAALFANLISIEREGYLQQRHPEQFITEAQQALSTMPDNPHPVKVFERFLKYECNRHGHHISCDQTPRNALFIDEILKHFPRAFIIAMIRDPRDVLLSQKGKWKRRFLGATSIPLRESIRSWLNYHPITITKLWSASTQNILKYRHHDRVRVVKFEDLLENSDLVIRDICNAVGIVYSDDMLNVPKVGSSNADDNHGKRGISSENKGNYRKGLSNTEIVMCEQQSKSVRQQLGYELAGVSANPFIMVFHYLSFPFKLGLALLFNLGRTKNLWATIKRRLS